MLRISFPFFTGSLSIYRHFFVALFVFIGLSGFSQNLVVNPSFENVVMGSLQCGPSASPAQFNAAISNWTSPNGASPDVYHTSHPTFCASSPSTTSPMAMGQQMPRTGNAHVNMIALVTASPSFYDYREYVQGELSSALDVGDCYQVSFWVSLGDNCSFGTDNIGVKFSNGGLTGPASTSVNRITTTPDYVHGTPITDDANWVEISFTYTPTVAGLDYITLGNFTDFAGTTQTAKAGSQPAAYYYLDDVSVEKIGTGGCVLPIELISFYGTPEESGIALNWSTASERNSHFFALERIDEQGEATEIAQIPASGNSNATIDYAYTDFEPKQGTNYYRLIGFDLDGSISHTETISVLWKTNSLQIFPNPAKEQVTIRMGDSDVKTIKLIASDGKIIRSLTTSATELEWNIVDIPDGVYQISIEGVEGTLYKRFVKRG